MAAWSDDETMKLIEFWGRTLYNGPLSVAIGTKMYAKKLLGTWRLLATLEARNKFLSS